MSIWSDFQKNADSSSWKMTPDNAFDAREALQLEESHAVAGLLEAGRVALVTVDSANKVTSWSAAAALIFGWEEGEVTGRRISILAPDGSLEAFLASARDLQPKHFETSCRTKAGKNILVDVLTCRIPANNHRQTFDDQGRDRIEVPRACVSGCRGARTAEDRPGNA